MTKQDGKIRITKRLLALTLGAMALSATTLLFSTQPSLSDGYRPCQLPSSVLGSFVKIEGGGFIKGSDSGYAEERPAPKVYVSPFLLQVNEVTNNQFAAFVADTAYITDAEQVSPDKPSGSAQFTETSTPWDLMSWWQLDPEANWKTPDGASSDIENKGQHPVVHISLNDARAYAKWAGGRIPTEVEWEFAASLGLFDPQDPESGIRAPDGSPRANIWNGMFPLVNTKEDGFAGTAPVGCYEKSLVGVWDMIGNVWEWTESRYDVSKPVFTIKGGSYLCGSNFCQRYRTSARQSLEQDFSTAHVGFRIVKDI